MAHGLRGSTTGRQFVWESAHNQILTLSRLCFNQLQARYEYFVNTENCKELLYSYNTVDAFMRACFSLKIKLQELYAIW